MKITVLDCPKCGAKLRISDNTGQMAHCEYCEYDFILEKEKPDISHTTVKNTYFGDTKVDTKTNQSPKQGHGFIIKFIILIAVIPLVISAIVAVCSSSLEDKTSSGANVFRPASNTLIARDIPQSELICAFAEHVFQKSADKVTREEYSSIRYLQIFYPESRPEGPSGNSLPLGFTIQYGFDDPITSAEPALYRYFYPVSDGDELLIWQDLQCFSGLTVLDLGGTRCDIIDDDRKDSALRMSNKCDLRNLENLRVYHGSYYQSLSDVTFADPGMIQELTLRLNNSADAELLPDFVGLEVLRVDYFTQDFDLSQLSVLPNLHTFEMEYFSNINGLSSLTGLKHLYLHDCWNITDFSVLYGMPGLVSLRIENIDNLKDINFVSNMPNLQLFSLIDSDVIEIEALRNKISLLSLTLDNNDDLTDYSPVATLRSLQHLSILDRGAVLPDLSSFHNLQTAEIYGMQFSSLANCSTLTQLSLYECKINGIAFSEMRNLISLKLQDCSLYDPAGLELLPVLTRLRIIDSEFTYDDYDWSCVFNLPHLEQLEIAGWLPINRNAINDNSSLKILSIQTDSYFSMLPEEHERTMYSAHPDVFLNFKELEELYLPGMKLQSIEFVSQMQRLNVLDIADNYIKDVGPIANLPDIEVLYHGGNPISNLALIPARVMLYDCRMPFLLEL